MKWIWKPKDIKTIHCTFQNALIHQELTACPRSFVLQKQIKTRFMWRKTWFRFKSSSAPNWLKCNFHWIFINTLSWIKLPTRASSFWKQSANLKWCLDNILSKTYWIWRSYIYLTFYAEIVLRCIERKHSFQKSTFSQLGRGYNQFAKGLSFGKRKILCLRYK